MSAKVHPILAMSCPECGSDKLTWQEGEARKLFEWEELLFTDIQASCSSCSWAYTLARIPLNSTMFKLNLGTP